MCFYHCEGVDRADLGGRFIGGVKWHWIALTLLLHLFVDFHHGIPSRLGFCIAHNAKPGCKELTGTEFVCSSGLYGLPGD